MTPKPIYDTSGGFCMSYFQRNLKEYRQRYNLSFGNAAFINQWFAKISLSSHMSYMLFI